MSAGVDQQVGFVKGSPPTAEKADAVDKPMSQMTIAEKLNKIDKILTAGLELHQQTMKQLLETSEVFDKLAVASSDMMDVIDEADKVKAFHTAQFQELGDLCAEFDRLVTAKDPVKHSDACKCNPCKCNPCLCGADAQAKHSPTNTTTTPVKSESPVPKVDVSEPVSSEAAEESKTKEQVTEAPVQETNLSEMTEPEATESEQHQQQEQREEQAAAPISSDETTVGENVPSTETQLEEHHH